MKNIILIGVIFFTIIVDITAQEIVDPQVQQISPISPNAASLGKFGNIPVSLYTGIPNIQIPIYEVKVKDFTLPITLDYHASGIKVDDIPSWIGMGWTLNAGGMISRQQRGIQDARMIEDKDYFNNDIETLLDPTSTANEVQSAAFHMGAANYDTESDIFSITAGNISHKFFLDADGTPYCMPARKLKIQPEGKLTLNGIDYYYFERWKVTDENGIQYIFGKTLDNSNVEVEITQINPACGVSTDNQKVVSSWYLNKIILPTGDSISFKYETFSFCVENTLQETFILDALKQESSRSAIYYEKALQIKEINYPLGKIKFVTGDERRDIDGTKVLDRIEIYSHNNGTYSIEKSFLIKTNNPAGNSWSGDNNFRLALLSVTEANENGETLPPYQFEYKDQYKSSYNFELPPRGSYAQDLWGYSNGVVDNSTLIPNFVVRNSTDEIVGYIEGADRSINSEKAQAGILTKITYPTGGTTEFFYDSNVARGAYDRSDPNSINPLNFLVNMDVLQLLPKTNNLSLENTNGYDIGYSEPFEIVHQAGREVFVDLCFTYFDDQAPVCTFVEPGGVGKLNDCVSLKLECRSDDGSFGSSIETLYYDRSYTLSPGTYRVRAEWNNPDQIYSWARIDLNWTDLYVSHPVVNEHTELKVGGLRIQKVVDYDPLNSIQHVRRYDYKFGDDDVQINGTSGTIQNVPLHLYSKTTAWYESFSSIPFLCYDCVHLTSYNNSSVLQTNGGNVGYKKVTVEFGENGEGGKTVSYFLSPEDYPDKNISESYLWPFPEVTRMDWRRGLDTIVINKTDIGVTTKKQTKIYHFNELPSDINYKKNNNLKFTKYPAMQIKDNDGNIHIAYDYKHSLYNTISESFFLKERQTIEHSENGDIISTDTNIQDNKTLQIASATITNSNGSNLKTMYYYPQDYDNNQYFSALLDNHIIAKPIDVRTYHGSQLSSGTQTEYNVDGQPIKTYVAEIDEGVSDIGFDNTNPYKFSHKATYEYNTDKVLKQVSPVDNINSSYIWSYNNSYPVVKAENIDHNTLKAAVESAANTTDLETFWGNLTTVTYDNSTWNSFNTSLRSNPVLKDAMLTTYTYTPLVGMTSQTGPDGRTIYYEYDSFGRLYLVRNHLGEIINKYHYHYANQE